MRTPWSVATPASSSVAILPSYQLVISCGAGEQTTYPTRNAASLEKALIALEFQKHNTFLPIFDNLLKFSCGIGSFFKNT